MSTDKKNGNGKTAPEAVTTAPEAKKELSPKEKVALFETWEQASAHTAKVRAQCERTLEAALDAESATVEAINKALGGSAKSYKGKTLYPVMAGRGGRYVMRGESTVTPEVIG